MAKKKDQPAIIVPPQPAIYTPPEIDDRWLDIDFRKQPEYVFGALKDTPRHFCSVFEDIPGMLLTDSEIDAVIERMDAEGGGADEFVTRIYNQGQEGSCVANACSQAHEIIQFLQYGKDAVIHLAAMSLYKRIGRSASSGANVGDGLEEMCSRGILPLDNEENRQRFGDKVMANTGFRSPFPSNWTETAAQIVGVEYHTVRTVQGLLSALCNQFPVIVGREGHSICYTRPMRRSGRRVVKYANSWGNWGDAGFGYDSESQIRKSSSFAYVLRTVKAPQKEAA